MYWDDFKGESNKKATKNDSNCVTDTVLASFHKLSHFSS